MEVLLNYGTEEQKQKWLTPLMEGTIRSCFCMTEPAVASSDATNIQTDMKLVGDNYVINGRKWWITGSAHPHLSVGIVMGKTDKTAAKHKQQSMLLVPWDTPGITVLRHLPVFGYDEAPGGHCEIVFDNVTVPAKDAMLLGEGRGFEIAQGRLGPGRIHHCMRLIGLASRCYELMVQRAMDRVAFGQSLYKHGTTAQDIAESRMQIEQARLLVLQAAHEIDQHGNKAAKTHIAMIKVVVPRMACQVIDRAMQVHGAAGMCDDFILAQAYALARTLRIADGPDAVHVASVAKGCVAEFK
eukprot:TRINITY_DN59642_c0_g1_i1.p1 TRINITY_DN59642_c0_g1~~TRINITY_DN59642_c0_g1_i1.p1  ORF type:complete len:338 (-),score=30.17 TRINITY_DN59642_c0_g1_i1:917-1810(-)